MRRQLSGSENLHRRGLGQAGTLNHGSSVSSVGDHSVLGHARGTMMAETPSHGVMTTIELGIAIRNKEEEEKDTASGGAPTHRIRHPHGGPRLAPRRGTMAAQFAWFPANRGGRARHTLSCGHVPLRAEDKSKKRSHLHAHMTSVARRGRRRNGRLRSTTAERGLQHQSLSR